MNKKFYNLIHHAGSGILAALLVGAGFTACTNDDIEPASLNRMLVLKPQVSLPGSLGESRAEGNANGTAYLGIKLNAFTNEIYPDELKVEQRMDITFPGNASGTIYVPGSDNYDFTLTGNGENSIPYFVGTYNSHNYAAQLKFEGENGTTANLTVKADGTMTIPLVFATAGVQLNFTTAEGYTVTAVTPNYVTADATDGTGCVNFLADLKDENLDVLSTNGEQWMSGAIIPAKYAAGVQLCTITIKSDTDSKEKTVTLLLPATTFDAGKLYTYTVIVDAVKATIGDVTVSDFDPQSEVEISTDKDYTYDTIGNTYTVYTAKGLHEVAKIVNNNNLNANITLGCNIDMSEVKDENDNTKTKSFTPIGISDLNSYAGTFNGNGMIISNLTVMGAKNAGLIGFLAGNAISGMGSVTNVTIKNPQISGVTYAGAVVGQNSSCPISNCWVIGTDTEKHYVKAEDSESLNSYAGGIVGYNNGNNAKVTSCTVNGIGISATNSFAYAKPTASAGGIVGCNYNNGSVGGTGVENYVRGCTISATCSNEANSGVIYGKNNGGTVGNNTDGGGNTDGNGNTITNNVNN